jgi:cysteine synthase
MNIATSAFELIGNTPMLEIKNIFPNINSRILAKMEIFNITSIKDRAAYNMINKAFIEGKIKDNTEVVEVSSGNTAIAIASLGAVMGFKTRFYMSALCSVERRQVLSAYGAKVVLTPAEEHTKGARQRALQYCSENPKTTFFMNQHGNPDNAEAHALTTGPELWQQTDGNIDAIIIGLGTSGTFEGLSKYIKSKKPDIKIIGFEPKNCPVYSGGEQGKHKIVGIGPGFISDNFERSQDNLDELILVSDEEAFEMTRNIARKEGVLVGPTSGASLWVAGQLAKRPEYKNKTIICFFYDTGERYLSTPDLFTDNFVEFVN